MVLASLSPLASWPSSWACSTEACGHLISLVPNVLPPARHRGLHGRTGHRPQRVSTSIIFTIAFGIAVDDTLHFLAKYRILLEQAAAAICGSD